MKALKTLLLTVVATGFFLNSCTVEKRVAGRGYHVEWNKRNTFVKGNSAKVEERVAIAKEPTREIQAEEELPTGVTVTSAGTDSVTGAIVSPEVVTAAQEVKPKAPASAKALVKKPVSADKKTAAIKNKKQLAAKKSASSDVPIGLLYILCVFIPFLAVGIVTDWRVSTVLLNILLTLLCVIPGIIHAIIVVQREY